MKRRAAKFLKASDAVGGKIEIFIDERTGDVIVTVHDNGFAMYLECFFPNSWVGACGHCLSEYRTGKSGK